MLLSGLLSKVVFASGGVVAVLVVARGAKNCWRVRAEDVGDCVK